MRILILGSDGYIGYPLTLHLLKKGHTIAGLDNLSRRARIKNLGGNSLTPIEEPSMREAYLKSTFIKYYGRSTWTLHEFSYPNVINMLDNFKPDAIVHLAEQPSAPWSMKQWGFATQTQLQNIIGTLQLLWAIHKQCPEAHLVKLGTMGEYGTPNCDIPEGRIPEECIAGHIIDMCPETFSPALKCPMSGLIFPRTAGSFYHLTKVHDTLNIEFACRNWGLRSTDIMQGVLFGLVGETHELTRFDYDEYFGTAINRFCAQALCGMPLTVYGKGNQTRGFLPLKDSLQCLTLALEQPPKLGEYRTLNQFENIYKINDLATMVCKAADQLGIGAKINHIPNPRLEAENHYYNPDHQNLFNMGYEPTTDIQNEILQLLDKLLPFSDRIIKDVIMPVTNWR